MVEVRQRLLTTATAAGNGTPVDVGGAGRDHTFYIETSNGTVSAGGVTLETARSVDYTGTWQALGLAITPVSNSVIVVTWSGALLAVRARISTAVTGGAAVTVEYVAN